MSENEEKIRQRAYEIWEREGRPEGRGHEHWSQARREIDKYGAPEGAALDTEKAGSGRPAPEGSRPGTGDLAGKPDAATPAKSTNTTRRS